jgi:hypothetical protein
MRPTVILTAGFPQREYDAEGLVELDALEAVEDAIVDTARAVFARGADLALPADDEVAPLVALVAAEYAAPARAEAERPPAPLRVFFTGGGDEGAQRLLRPLTARGAAQVEPAGPEPLARSERGRHRVDPWMIERTRPVGAIVFGGALESAEDVAVLVASEVDTAVIGPAVLPGLELGDLLERGAWDAAADLPYREERRDRSPPIPFVVQRIVERWLPRGEGLTASERR